MILAALYDLAVREKLLVDPDVDAHRIDIVIRLAASGHVLAVDHVSKAGAPRMSMAPRVPTGRSGATSKPALLFDNASYVLGVGAVAEQRSLDFRVLTTQVAADTRDEGAIAVMRFLHSAPSRLDVLRMIRDWPKGLPAGAWIAFQLDGEPGLVHERPAVLAWNRANRSQAGETTTDCMITGLQCVPVRLHPMVKMPGTKGASLVSFNQPSFASFGFEQGENAPMSRDVAEGYVTALNWLLGREGAPKGEGRRFRGATMIGDDVLVAWSTDPGSLVATELLEVVEGTRSLAHATKLDANGIFAMILGTNRTRIVIRSAGEHVAWDLIGRLFAFAEDIGWPATEPLPSIRWMAEALRLPSIPPTWSVAMIAALFEGRPFPPHVTKYATATLLQSELGDRTTKLLLGLITGSLRRRGETVPMALDETVTAVPYVLGRLFALIESLQYIAHGVRVGTTVRDRYLSAACARPAATFPQMMRLSRAHANKAFNRVRSTWYEREKGTVLSLLGTAPLPAVLGPDAQGVFLLGYYHQRHAILTHAKTTTSPANNDSVAQSGNQEPQ